MLICQAWKESKELVVYEFHINLLGDEAINQNLEVLPIWNDVFNISALSFLPIAQHWFALPFTAARQACKCHFCSWIPNCLHIDIRSPQGELDENDTETTDFHRHFPYERKHQTLDRTWEVVSSQRKDKRVLCWNATSYHSWLLTRRLKCACRFNFRKTAKQMESFSAPYRSITVFHKWRDSVLRVILPLFMSRPLSELFSRFQHLPPDLGISQSPLLDNNLSLYWCTTQWCTSN